MAAVLGFQAYNNHELASIELDTAEAYLYFWDRQINEEIDPEVLVTIENADQLIRNIESILKVTHSDEPDFEQILSDLGGEESEYGFLINREDFDNILLFVGEELSVIDDEHDLGLAVSNKDKLEEFGRSINWDEVTVYVNRYGDE